MSNMKNHVQPGTQELRQRGCYEFKVSLGSYKASSPTPPHPPKKKKTNQTKMKKWLEAQREGAACSVSHSQLSFEPKSI